MKRDYLSEPVTIPIGRVRLKGDMALPREGGGFVVFAHGSGSSRLSVRNRFVAGEFFRQGIGSLLFDLLTEEEDEEYENRFRIEGLTKRLIATVNWISQRPDVRDAALGLFGASTGAAAALQAAAFLGPLIKAVVSRGGRPDLAGNLLAEVEAPTLLIVGGLDEPVIELNEDAYDWLTCEKKLVIVPGATHLFEEAGALEEVAKLAADWFEKHLMGARARGKVLGDVTG